MFSLLFRNHRFALGWAALTLASVALFAGEDGGADRLAESARQVRLQRDLLAGHPVPPPPSAPLPEPSTEPEPTELWAVPGSSADPANPKPGDVFIDPVTGARVRAVRREDAAAYEPAFPRE